MLWLSLLTALVLAGCSQDRTLETLIPRNALAVVLVDHPGIVAHALEPEVGDLPWKALEGGKPWAAAVLPGPIPGFLLALALADDPSAWENVQAWARQRGGLDAVRFGSYAVLSSPGAPAPAVFDPEGRFDLGRVRGGDPVEAYLDIRNWGESGLLPVSGWWAAPMGWVQRNLAGIRLGLTTKDGGLEVKLTTDWQPGSPAAEGLRRAGNPADLAAWTGNLPLTGGGLAVSVPRPLFEALGSVFGDSALARRWSALAPLIGPRLAVSVTPGTDGSWSWAAALESRDPQAVRQAVKTLIAGGYLQRHFAQWALDLDTPLIYQDRPGAGGIRTVITLGPGTVQIGYGEDRVAFAGGTGAVEVLDRWSKPAVAASWYREVPAAPSLVATGFWGGLGARGAVKLLPDGNMELRVWVDAGALKGWQERFPQVARSWLSGEASSRKRRTPRRRRCRHPRRATPGS